MVELIYWISKINFNYGFIRNNRFILKQNLDLNKKKCVYQMSYILISKNIS